MLALNPPPECATIIEKAHRGRSTEALQGAAAPRDAASNGAAKIAVHVTLAPALAGKVPAGAPLFVAARDPQVAGTAVRGESGCRRRFRWTSNSRPPTPCCDRAASPPDRQLEVVARVALGGTPTATSGDPFGQVSYHVGKDGRLNIVIDRLSP